MASRLSQEEENYVRISLLLTGISPRAARALFDKVFIPSCLDSSLKNEYNKLKELQIKRVINQSQWNLLFPRFPKVPDSKTFDVMLIITLVRHLTGLKPPLGGYDQLPFAYDTTPTSDLARIKYYRNFLAHLDEGKVDNTTFTIAWDNIAAAIRRLGGQQMMQECDDLKVRKLEETNQEIRLDTKSSQNEIMELKMSLKILQKVNEDMMMNMRKLGMSVKTAVPNKDIKGIEESDSDESMELHTCGKCKREFTLLTDFMKHRMTCKRKQVMTKESYSYQKERYKMRTSVARKSYNKQSMEMFQSCQDFLNTGIGKPDLGIGESDSDEPMELHTCGKCKRNFTLLANFVIHKDTCNQMWKGRSARIFMLQQQTKTDTPSSQLLTSPSQTKTQHNGPKITSGASETQTKQIPPRPGSGSGPSQGPGMPIAPMGMHPQKRIMPPFMYGISPTGFPLNYQVMPPRFPFDASEKLVFSDKEGEDKEGKGERKVRKSSKTSEEEKGKNENVKPWPMNAYDFIRRPPRGYPPFPPPYIMPPGPPNQPPLSMSTAVTPTKKPVEDDGEVWRQRKEGRSDAIERTRYWIEDEEKKIGQDRKAASAKKLRQLDERTRKKKDDSDKEGKSDTKSEGISSRTPSESSEKDSRERSYSREQHKLSLGTNKTSSRTVPPHFQRQQSDQQMPPRSQPKQQPGSPQPHPAQMRPGQPPPPTGFWPPMPFMGYGPTPPMDMSNMTMYPPVRRRNDSHGSGTESQHNDGKHDYERDPRAWQNYPVHVPPHPVPLLMSSFLCDGHAIDCIIDRRLVEYYSMPRKSTKDFLKLKEDMEKGEQNAFQNLILVSTFLKERKQCSLSLSRELLILSVKTKQDLLCRLLLSYITDRENHLPDLLEVLSIAMGEEQNYSANAIAWLITKTFFLEYKVVLLDCILDVWPAFKCKCKGEYEKQVCSSHVVIVVELESEINNEQIPDKYFSVEVVFLTNRISNEKNTKTELQDSVADILFADDKPITGLSARNLFAKHRKLTLISKSSFHQHGIEKQSVNLFCRVKGLIPIGENHLPRSFCSLPTKIQQGRPQLMTNIRVGDKIGTDDFKKGTLGGFLKVRGDKVFLTCLHILLSTDDLASENITLNDEQPLSIKCYPAGESSDASNTTSYVCGKIRDIAFKTDNCESTSIDAALIKVKKGIEICPTDYAVTGNENTVNHGQIGLHSPFLNNSCVDFRKFCYTHPKPSVTTVSVGAISGMNEVGSEIMENSAFGTDLEPFNQSFDNVFLDGMKHIATCVIESIRRSRNPFIPLEKQIMDTVEDQSKGHFQAETIQNIAKIVYEVCTKTGSNGQGDAQLEVNELLHKATFDRTSSSFSAIVGDVHLQTTFLKWTVDRETSKRTSRKMYGQIHISNIPFKPGDSGSCIYVTHPEKGCIGLAIANHPNGGCIATPIMEILKHFNIRHGQNQ